MPEASESTKAPGPLHFDWSKLDVPDQTYRQRNKSRVLNLFAERLMEKLKSKKLESSGAEAIAEILDATTDLINQITAESRKKNNKNKDKEEQKYHLDSRWFPKLLQAVFDHEPPMIQIRRPRNEELERQLTNHLRSRAGKQWHGDVVVAWGEQQEDNFFRVAAEQLIKTLFKIRKDKQKLRVGVVSGTTCGGVIREVMKIKWRQDLGISDTLPPVEVYALNVCLGLGADLQNNATILAFQLAKAIEDNGVNAVPYGLSAELLIEYHRRKDVDRALQTRDVVSITQPGRCDDNYDGPVTLLDLILTGIGSRPDDKNPDRSYFLKLIRDFDVNVQRLKDQVMVGDLIYTAINPNGQGLPLEKLKKNNETGSEAYERYEFYSAVELGVLKAMVENKNSQEVLLVVRDAKTTEKLFALRAALFGTDGPYASMIVLDESTARSLKDDAP